MKNFHRFIHLFAFILITISGCSVQKNNLPGGLWNAAVIREDGKQIEFILEVTNHAGKEIINIINGQEKISIDQLEKKDDSIIITLPFFDSEFRVKQHTDNSLKGTWVRDLGTYTISMPFRATPGEGIRFKSHAAPEFDITGRWSAIFIKEGNREVDAIGEFTQQGNKLTGTFLLPSGDYRFLEGIVSGDSIKLSAFDGNHAFSFEATILNDSTITNGRFYSGRITAEDWKASKNAAASDEERIVTEMRPGKSSLNFSFRSTGGETISIKDPEYSGKVVLVQIMGSWCPNCMDESQFLSEYYSANKNKDIKIIALAYERTTDFNKSVAALKSFQNRLNIEYPVLVTEVAVSDSLRTEKTLPELTEIKYFPTLIYIDKKGRVRKIHAGFRGPGTGEHYTRFVQEFERMVGQLLAE